MVHGWMFASVHWSPCAFTGMHLQSHWAPCAFIGMHPYQPPIKMPPTTFLPHPGFYVQVFILHILKETARPSVCARQVRGSILRNFGRLVAYLCRVVSDVLPKCALSLHRHAWMPYSSRWRLWKKQRRVPRGLAPALVMRMIFPLPVMSLMAWEVANRESVGLLCLPRPFRGTAMGLLCYVSSPVATGCPSAGLGGARVVFPRPGSLRF